MVYCIDGERFGKFTQNPWTGRYILGVTLLSNYPLAAGRGTPNATISIVAPDGESRLKYELKPVLVKSWSTSGSGQD